MARVFILALDALEYDLVQKWKLSFLKQRIYGKIALSSKYYHPEEEVPYTPIVWASFLSGIRPELHNVKTFFTYGKVLDYIRKFPIISWIKGKRRLLKRLGIKPRAINRRDITYETIFDKVRPSIAINVPTINEPSTIFERLANAMKKGGIEEYEKEVWKIHKEIENQVFKNISSNWNLFVAYFNTADLLGHIFFGKCILKLLNCYLELNQLTKRIKERLPDKAIFLIISDHGMELAEDGVTGRHSKHAFWSLNIETDWKPQDITDFYSKIIKWSRQN